MKFNYDKIADAFYLNINKGKVKKTIEMNDDVNVDVGEKDKVIGVEILNFSRKLDRGWNIKDLLKNGIPLQAKDAVLVSA